MTTPSTENQAGSAAAGEKPQHPFCLIGELMNNSFARARKAWKKRDLKLS